MRKRKNKKFDNHLSLRLTQKAGTDDDVLEFLNSYEGDLSQLVIKALKYWMRKGHEKPDQIRKSIEREAMDMDKNYRKYGMNRGPYKKKENRTLEDPKLVIKTAEEETVMREVIEKAVPETPKIFKESNVIGMVGSGAEDDLFGEKKEKKSGTKGANVLKGIGRRG